MSLDKFKGCLVGGLIGDCLGCPFESNWVIAPKHVNDFFNILQTSDSEDQLNYTDDTAMAFNILDSLYETEYYNSKDMATRFVDTYYKERHRGYGCNVIEIFSSWKTDGVDEVYQPAQKQFEGSGSCGNGGAMRVAPVALYGYKNHKETVKLAMLTTQLTHVHPFGIVGALIQCFAVRFALDEDPSVPLDVDKFVEKLRIRVVALETKSGLKKVYSKQLEYLKDYVKMKKVTVKDVVKVFGNSVIAQRSVVTALYCFLRGLYPVDFLSATNPFERVIQLAVAVGGDTDTIACMAGSIAGGYLGFNRIPVYLQRRCEGLEKCFLYSAWLHERLATSGLKAMRYT